MSSNGSYPTFTADEFRIGAMVFELLQQLITRATTLAVERIRWGVLEGPRAMARWEDDGGTVAKGN